MGGTPFDVPDVEFTHYKDQCTFDFFVKKYGITDPAVHTLAVIVRGADTDRHDLAPQAAGLWAISAGLAFNTTDDQELLQKGMMLYDALYSWAKHLQNERHTQSPTEHLLLNVFHQFIQQKAKGKKVPSWAKELKEMIQDQIYTNLTLKEISKDMELHPLTSHGSFPNILTISPLANTSANGALKVLNLLQTTSYSLTKIAYLTGFSDQSHFTRTFKQQVGKAHPLTEKLCKKVMVVQMFNHVLFHGRCANYTCGEYEFSAYVYNRAD